MYQMLTNFLLRLFHGSKLILTSFKAYFYYPKLLLFPMLTGLFSGLAFFAIISLSLPWWSELNAKQDVLFFAMFAFLIFALLCIKAFMATTMAYAVHEYCQKNHASLSEAFLNSSKKLWLIIRWASIELIAHLIAGKDEKSPGTTLWGFIWGTSWQLLTFFIYPLFCI